MIRVEGFYSFGTFERFLWQMVDVVSTLGYVELHLGSSITLMVNESNLNDSDMTLLPGRLKNKTLKTFKVK